MQPSLSQCYTVQILYITENIFCNKNCTSWKTKNKILQQSWKTNNFLFVSGKICTHLSDTGMFSLFHVSNCLTIIDFMRIHWSNMNLFYFCACDEFLVQAVLYFFHSGFFLNCAHLNFSLFPKWHFHLLHDTSIF